MQGEAALPDLDGTGNGAVHMADYWLGHRERLRLRAQTSGLASLRPHEQLELVLFYAVPRADMTDIARALLNALGSVQAVFVASEAELLAVPGVTKGIARWIMMTGELIDAYADIDRESLTRLTCFKNVMDFLAPLRRDVPAPRCWVIFTDYDDRLMTYSTVCDSLFWADPRCVREIVGEALALQARCAFLVLFTGTEVFEPDDRDREDLVDLSRTLRAVGVELMDCVLAGETGFFSMKRMDMLETVSAESPLPGLHERYLEDDNMYME